MRIVFCFYMAPFIKYSLSTFRELKLSSRSRKGVTGVQHPCPPPCLCFACAASFELTAWSVRAPDEALWELWALSWTTDQGMGWLEPPGWALPPFALSLTLPPHFRRQEGTRGTSQQELTCNMAKGRVRPHYHIPTGSGSAPGKDYWAKKDFGTYQEPSWVKDRVPHGRT